VVLIDVEPLIAAVKALVLNKALMPKSKYPAARDSINKLIKAARANYIEAAK